MPSLFLTLLLQYQAIVDGMIQAKERLIGTEIVVERHLPTQDPLLITHLVSR